jgi:hypothetical protein
LVAAVALDGASIQAVRARGEVHAFGSRRVRGRMCLRRGSLPYHVVAGHAGGIGLRRREAGAVQATGRRDPAGARSRSRGATHVHSARGRAVPVGGSLCDVPATAVPRSAHRAGCQCHGGKWRA